MESEMHIPNRMSVMDEDVAGLRQNPTRQLTNDGIVTQGRVLNASLLRRVEAFTLVNAGVYSIQEAMTLLDLARSTVYKLLAEFRRGGAEAVSTAAIRSGNARTYPANFRADVLNIIREEYADYGPQLIRESLEADHDIRLSRETIRRWMLKAGLWISNRAARRLLHQPRKRMQRLGELVQIDGSDHDWFEGRGARCTAMVFVDDATGRTQVTMFPSESGHAYFASTYQYIEANGRPLRFYTDKHTAVYVRDGKTSWGKSMDRLNILHSVANYAEGKGRVENRHRTLQDRLVKAFRKEGICSIDQANAFLPSFLARFNERFSKVPALLEDAHRPIIPPMDLDRAMSIVEERRVTRQLVFTYEGTRYVIKATAREAPSILPRVTVERRVSGEIAVYGTAGLLNVRRV